jgi:hypothetical protein
VDAIAGILFFTRKKDLRELIKQFNLGAPRLCVLVPAQQIITQRMFEMLRDKGWPWFPNRSAKR